MLVRSDGATLLDLCFFFFFFNDTATTEIYTLSLHDALPICPGPQSDRGLLPRQPRHEGDLGAAVLDLPLRPPPHGRNAELAALGRRQLAAQCQRSPRRIPPWADSRYAQAALGPEMERLRIRFWGEIEQG